MTKLLGLAFLPLLGGFIFLVFYRETGIRAYRYSGYKLIFYSAFWGLIGDLASRLILGIGQTFIFSELIHAAIATPALAPIFSESPAPYSFQQLFAFFLLATAWMPLNLLLRPNQAARRAVLSLGTYLDKLLLEAQEHDLLISITLKNRKVYIGYVIEPSFSSLRTYDTQNSYLIILPVLSGFRRDSNLQITLTTRYYEIWGDDEVLLETGLTPADFAVTIPESELVSVSKFDYFAYLRSTSKT